jgi:hypothetical protein
MDAAPATAVRSIPETWLSPSSEVTPRTKTGYVGKKAIDDCWPGVYAYPSVAIL